MQHGNETLALALDDIVDVLRGMEGMRLDEGLDYGLLVRREDKRAKGFLVPLDFADTGDGELKPELLAESEAQNNRRGNKKLLLGELALLSICGTFNAVHLLLLDLTAVLVDFDLNDACTSICILNNLVHRPWRIRATAMLRVRV